jgi:hypothetical protein
MVGRLDGKKFPDPAALTCLLPPETVTASGKPVRFRPGSEIPGVDYERHIYETGEVSTRNDSWHDLFNAFAWCRFPHLKAAMNALHYRQLDQARDGRRGRQRDALTLLDESGVIVTSPDAALLEALKQRDWQDAFVTRRGAWARCGVIVCGHAILEKFLRPYKALTAHALHVHLGAGTCAADLDGELARGLLEDGRLETTQDLSPLPLMGIPGWSTAGAQDAAFYADRDVFRPPPICPGN